MDRCRTDVDGLSDQGPMEGPCNHMEQQMDEVGRKTKKVGGKRKTIQHA